MPFGPYPGGGGPEWEGFTGRIEARFGQQMGRPFWLWPVATADLPTIPELGANEGALAYDDTLNRPTFYNGSAWVPLSTTSGTVTSVSVTTANGVSGSVANPTTTPAITLTLAAITPTTVTASGTVSSAVEFRLGNSFSRIATVDSGGSFGGGYNLDWNNAAPRYDSTGTIAGYGYTNASEVIFYAGVSAAAGTAAPGVIKITAAGIEPVTDNAFYVGRNSSTSPKAFKGIIMKDTVTGTYYRIEISSGALTLVSL